ncbi:hypothetical protein J6590_087669 [Homalodisca vitripennis]|nr:hypothetical protein J6590_087669 [Homalodisca vitripennis]
MEDCSGKNAIIIIQPTVAQNEDGSEKLLDVLPEYTEQTTITLAIDPEEEDSTPVRSIRKGLRSAANNYENAEGAVYGTVIPKMEQTLRKILEHEGKIQGIALTAYLSQKEQKRCKREEIKENTNLASRTEVIRNTGMVVVMDLDETTSKEEVEDAVRMEIGNKVAVTVSLSENPNPWGYKAATVIVPKKSCTTC